MAGRRPGRWCRRHASAFRTLDQLARTPVVPRCDDVDRAHAVRMLAQSRGDGVEAGEITGVGHRGGSFRPE